MRTLILHFLDEKNSKNKEILANLKKGAESNGNEVEVFNARCDSSENLHLVKYEYVSVVVPCTQFIGAKLPPKLKEIFASCGSVSGKKGCAVVLKYGLSSNKMVRVLMKELESNGLVLDYFDVVLNVEHSVSVGKKIG